MDIILKQPVKNLGDTNDIVSVKPGYARNFLLPKGMALLATPSNKKIVEENKRQAAHKQVFVTQQAQELANKLNEVVLDIETLAGADGKLFGSVTNLQIAAQLKEKGYEIDRKIITVDDIHSLGEYEAIVHLHKEVKATVKLNVLRRAE